MTQDWLERPLSEVVSLHRGYDLPTKDRVPGAVPVMGSFGVTGWHNIAKVCGPGVTVGRSGASYGVVARTQKDFWPLNTCLYVDDFHGNETNWVYFLLSQIDFSAYNSGSAQPSLNRNYIKHIRVRVPPPGEQERIAGVLGAFDDLIETNRRLALQLDEARRTRVAAALAASTFETCLSDAAAFVNGRNFTKGASGSGRPVIRTPEVRSGPVGNTVWSSVDAESDRVAKAGDILFVWSGTLMVNRWLYTEGLVNQHVFKVIPNGVPDWYVYALIEAQLSWFLGLAKDKATTMGHIQRAHLDESMTGLDGETIKSLSSAIEPLWSSALALRIEAQDLARQRDELLPLLMSGKVRVREVEAAVS